MVQDNEFVGSRALRYMDYVNECGVGELLSRQHFMARLGSSYTAARYNLERAVSLGKLVKLHGFTNDNQPGWLYALPETQPRLEGM